MRHSSLFWMSLQWGWDEQDNGYLLLMTLPVMRKTYVIGKYIFGLLFGGCAWLIAVAISLAFKVANHSQFTLPDFVMEVFMCLPIAIFVLAIMLPFQFKFGSERGRIVLVIAFSAGILCVFLLEKGLGMMGKDLGQIWDSLFDLHAGLVEMLSFGVAIVAVVLSCATSCHIMDRKEF